jgi:prepilin signal peptidase PulO-like enzyme (type II secretory pathway)
MTSNRFGYLYKKSFHLHRMNDTDDLNLYYKKFLIKLSKICLKIFLPLFPFIYFFTLFLCRLLLYNTPLITFDIRTIIYFLCFVSTFILLFLIRFHTKWKTVWFCTRIFLIGILILPLILTYQTEQYHILFSTISITIIYSLLTFTLIQSLTICLGISILHIILLLNQKNEIYWKSLEFFSIIFYHFIINIAGLYTYIRSIRHIRQHFHAYETNLYEKNRFNVDCKKLNTIIGYCQQPQRMIGRMSKVSNGFHIQ